LSSRSHHKHLAQRDDSMSFVALEALLDAVQPVLARTIGDDSDGPSTGRSGTVHGDA
jgi:hypothetical protein